MVSLSTLPALRTMANILPWLLVVAILVRVLFVQSTSLADAGEQTTELRTDVNQAVIELTTSSPLPVRPWGRRSTADWKHYTVLLPARPSGKRLARADTPRRFVINELAG